jgi:lysophospholipase L1-like esterase
MKKVAIIIFFFLVIGVYAQPVTIVVLGASTAAGKNLPENGDSLADSWVNRYTAYVTGLRPGSQIINLAVSGYNTYHGLPTGSAEVTGRPTPDIAKNITAAIATNPDAIITNYVGDGGFGNDETMANLTVIAVEATKAGIPLWVATTQPSINGQTSTVIAERQDQSNRVIAQFESHAIDFWSPLADSSGSGLAARNLIQTYDYGHPNAEGRRDRF